eukprot:COSAG06_NODE_15848_length_1040_cov_1.352816_1_plen_162_part_10
MNPGVHVGNHSILDLTNLRNAPNRDGSVEILAGAAALLLLKLRVCRPSSNCVTYRQIEQAEATAHHRQWQVAPSDVMQDSAQSIPGLLAQSDGCKQEGLDARKRPPTKQQSWMHKQVGVQAAEAVAVADAEAVKPHAVGRDRDMRCRCYAVGVSSADVQQQE